MLLLDLGLLNELYGISMTLILFPTLCMDGSTGVPFDTISCATSILMLSKTKFDELSLRNKYF